MPRKELDFSIMIMIGSMCMVQAASSAHERAFYLRGRIAKPIRHLNSHAGSGLQWLPMWYNGED